MIKGHIILCLLIVTIVVFGAAAKADDCPPPTPTPTKPSVVQLVRLEAHANSVEWETGIEINTVGFNVLRAFAHTGTYTRANVSLIPAKTPGGVQGDVYTFTDTECADCACYYKLEEVETGGDTHEYGPVFNEVQASTSVTVTDADTEPDASNAALGVAIFLLLCAIGVTVLTLSDKL